MRLQLLEIYQEPEKKVKTIKIVVAIIIIIIALFLIPSLGKSKKKIAEQENILNQQREEMASKEQDVVNAETDTQTENSKNKLPVLTELGIQNINNIYNSEEKIVYLTFDDGPSSSITPLILDKLKENNIKATFFVLGSRVDLLPELVKREYEEGHYIANHGYSHVYSKIYQSAQSVVEEYYQCEYAIRCAIEEERYGSHLFRYPGGSNGGKYNDLKKEAAELLLGIGVVYIDWNCLTDDSAGANTKEALMDKLINTSAGKNNLVVLMHDAGDKILTYEMLQDSIDYFRNEGYTFKNFYDVIK